VQKLDIPDEGLMVWLRNFGQVKLFRTRLKDELRHYVTYLPNADDYPCVRRFLDKALLERVYDLFLVK